MSKSVPKRSITDHFAVIPKEPKKEIKMHPMFLKTKKKAPPPTVEEVVTPTQQIQEGSEQIHVESVLSATQATSATPTPATPALATPAVLPYIKTRSAQAKPISAQLAPIHPASAQPEQPAQFNSNQKQKSVTVRKKRLSQKQPPKLDTHDYFKHRKEQRENKQLLPSLGPYLSQTKLDLESIKERMNQDYPRWEKDTCCKTFFETMMFKESNPKLLWCDKYRPNRVEGLLGHQPDFKYLRDWLEVLKIQKDPTKKKKEGFDGEEQVYNLILLVGDCGTGKTAAAYTAAKETGYTVFEINSSTRRAGKDVAKLVGEMTASHLVRFDYHASKKRKKGETIILRDTVKKKPKKIDIAMHFKRMLSMDVPKEEKQVTDIDVDMETTTKEAEKDVIMEDTEPMDELNLSSSDVTIKKDEHKQSLVLLEEVDILFEDDKGFWPAVIELCQKSKRPIIMTCNGNYC